ncbi:MAG: septum formation family protein [Chloroflexota bacterium]
MRSALAVAGLTIMLGIGACAGSRSAPASLKPGDCFDVPTGSSITEIPTRSCTEPHGGEVFHAFDASAGAGSYPTDADWAHLIYPVCDPAFEEYTGTPVAERTDIDYSYFVPTDDRFADGDRRVTCFIRSLEGGQLRQPYRKSP